MSPFTTEKSCNMEDSDVAFPGFRTCVFKDECMLMRRSLSRLQRQAPTPLQLKTLVQQANPSQNKMDGGDLNHSSSSSSSSSSLSLCHDKAPIKAPIPLLTPLVSPTLPGNSARST